MASIQALGPPTHQVKSFNDVYLFQTQYSLLQYARGILAPADLVFWYHVQKVHCHHPPNAIFTQIKHYFS